jgi:hypothetical protein
MTGQLAVRAVTGGHGRGPRGRLTTLYSGVRGCPIPGCGQEIDPSRLMCRRHWYTVPKEVRDRVWATWRSGQGAYSREHQDAVRAAIAAVGAAIGLAVGQAAADGPAKPPPSGGPRPGKAGRVPVT